jgi:hypothetical protein
MISSRSLLSRNMVAMVDHFVCIVLLCLSTEGLNHLGLLSCWSFVFEMCCNLCAYKHKNLFRTFHLLWCHLKCQISWSLWYKQARPSSCYRDVDTAATYEFLTFTMCLSKTLTIDFNLVWLFVPQINIWSYKNRELLHDIDTGHSANIFCTKFVPETCDEVVASGAGDAEVHFIYCFPFPCFNSKYGGVFLKNTCWLFSRFVYSICLV